jgi:hypothetical protein
MATNSIPISSLIKQKAALQKQIKAARQREFKKAAMTSAEYRKAVEHDLGIDLAQAGILFGVSTRTSQRWALDELPVPKTVAHLLQLMKKYKVTAEQLDRSVLTGGTTAAA